MSPSLLPRKRSSPTSPPTLMIRRGASGGSEELLSQAQQAGVDRLCQAELRRIGSDFPYVREFGLSEHQSLVMRMRPEGAALAGHSRR